MLRSIVFSQVATNAGVLPLISLQATTPILILLTSNFLSLLMDQVGNC